LKNRDAFVKQVALTMRERHGTDSESFVFGISGKWGEGKTRFLDDLEGELGPAFLVVRVEPWKYAADKISLLRSFLRSVYEALPWWRRRLAGLVARFRRHRSLSEMTYDTSRTRISWGNAALAMAALVAAYWAYKSLLPAAVHDWMSANKTFLVLLAIPVAVPALAKLTVNETSSKSVATLDEFEDLLKDLLVGAVGRKMVVFVDDLDRVSESAAREVLDSLRTFFDRRDVSYVVTADHSVLERGMGREMRPDDKTEQPAEGRRFLKKIFSIYWRLPLPVDSELAAYVDEEIAKREAPLAECELGDTERQILAGWLTQYFDKNLRNIDRFLDLAVFTLRGVRQQWAQGEPADDSETDQAYLQEMATKPLLVVRVLMYQELCTPLFDRMLSDSSFTNEFEVAADSEAGVEEPLGRLVAGAGQKAFALRFAQEKPRFVEDGNRKVRDIQSFLHLAGDSSFSDNRGPDPEEFARLLRLGSLDEVADVLKGSGPERLGACGNKLKALLGEVATPTEQASLLNGAVGALVPLPPEHDAHAVFAETLASVDLSCYQQLDPTTRVNSFIDYWWKWLDGSGGAHRGTFAALFMSSSLDDLRAVRREPMGDNASTAVAGWVTAVYPADPEGALTQLDELRESIQCAPVTPALHGLQTAIIESVATCADDVARDRRLRIIQTFLPEAGGELQEVVLSGVSCRREDMWQWAKAHAAAGTDCMPMADDLAAVVAQNVLDAGDVAQLVDAMKFASGKVEASIVWPRLLDDRPELVLGALPALVLQNEIADMAPQPEQASRLFDGVRMAQADRNPAERAALLQCLDRARWIWSKTGPKDLGKPGVKFLFGASRSSDAVVRQAAISARASWAKQAS
jgi:hypothetical protein